MFSAFSFGKVIKTILPGSVFAAGLVLLIEAVRLLLWGRAGSLFSIIANKEWLTVATAVLVPASLILGFLLNTFVWLVLNQRMRSEVNAELQGTPFPGIRGKLSEELWSKMAQFRPASKADEPAEKNPARDALEYFYLPVVSLAHLNYLWESYFSWYEFQINTAVAFLLATPGMILYLWITMVMPFALFVFVGLAIVSMVTFLFCALWYAARKNLVEYEKGLMLLVTGALTFQPKGSASGDSNPFTY